MVYHIFGKLRSISLVTPRPDYCHTCSQSRNHSNRICLTKWSRPKGPRKTRHAGQGNSRRNEKETTWDPSVWKRFKNNLLFLKFHKWRTHGTALRLPRRIQNYPECAATTHPRGHKRAQSGLQDSLASLEGSVRDSTARKELAGMACMAKFHNKNHCWRTRTHRLVSILPENICQDFWKKKYSVDWRIFDFLEGHYIYRKSSTAFQKRVIVLMVKYGGGSVTGCTSKSTSDWLKKNEKIKWRLWSGRVAKSKSWPESDWDAAAWP